MRTYKGTPSDVEHSIQAFRNVLNPRLPFIENFLNYYKSQDSTRYSYSYIRSYTNNFPKNIGKRGFGIVYKHKLSGRYLIVVKILDKYK